MSNLFDSSFSIPNNILKSVSSIPVGRALHIISFIFYLFCCWMDKMERKWIFFSPSNQREKKKKDRRKFFLNSFLSVEPVGRDLKKNVRFDRTQQDFVFGRRRLLFDLFPFFFPTTRGANNKENGGWEEENRVAQQRPFSLRFTVVLLHLLK